MSLLTIPAIMAAGAVAGCLGALLGIGGGVFLMPFLNVGLGLELPVAAGIGLMTVIATSSVVAAGTRTATSSTCGSAWCSRSPPWRAG